MVICFDDDVIERQNLNLITIIICELTMVQVVLYGQLNVQAENTMVNWLVE